MIAKRRTFFLKIFRLAACALILLASVPDGQAAVIGHFQVRQERVDKSGVLISRPVANDKRLADILYMNNIDSIEAYAVWLKDNIVYQDDNEKDVWAEPLETLLRRMGDCEDFSLLTAAVLRMMGFQPRFLAMVGEEEAHAICAFLYNGEYVWFDNAQLKTTGTRNFDAFVEHLVSEYHYSSLKEMDLATRDWKVQYEAS